MSMRKALVPDGFNSKFYKSFKKQVIPNTANIFHSVANGV